MNTRREVPLGSKSNGYNAINGKLGDWETEESREKERGRQPTSSQSIFAYQFSLLVTQ